MADNPPHHEFKEFWELVLENYWEEVIKLYYEDSNFHKIDIMGRGTALHVAVSLRRTKVVEHLVNAIVRHGDQSCLYILNRIGVTPLHVAADAGFLDVCQVLIGKDGKRNFLIKEPNGDGETPLFWAVNSREMIVFVYLRQFHPIDLNIAINNNGDSILHVAIQRERFDLAIIIMHYYKGLCFMKNQKDITPLQILATRTSAFKSINTLSWWKKILYHCFAVSIADIKTALEMAEKRVIIEPDDYSEVTIPIYLSEELEMAIEERHSLAQYCYRIKMIVSLTILSLLDFEAIKIIKEKHIYGGLLLKEFMQNPTYSFFGGGGDPKGGFQYEYEMGNEFRSFFLGEEERGGLWQIQKYERSEDSAYINAKDTYLTAASYGIVEIMSEFESKIKSVVGEINSNRENALLLAVKNRQPHVIERLTKVLRAGDFQNLRLQIDDNGNTVLHLAALPYYMEKNTWTDDVMRLSWDIKWYKYIQEIVPEDFNNKVNDEGETPSQIFEKEHEKLLQINIDKLKETTDSYSVVAALIASVSFATSGSVPGGNQQTGEPALKGQPAFEVFAISSLIGLYFSITALIMFLSIITSPKKVEEFRRNLPMKHLLGLSSLFISIVAIFVSFCAGHFFVLADKYTKGSILFYLYFSVFLPVAFYASVQFPLFADLVRLIWKKVPPPASKNSFL